MTEPPGSAEDRALRAEFDRQKARIRAMSDRQRAMREAARLAREIDAFRPEAMQLRDEIARELARDGASLSVIARLAEVGRARAQNFLGKKPKRGRHEDSS